MDFDEAQWLCHSQVVTKEKLPCISYSHVPLLLFSSFHIRSEENGHLLEDTWGKGELVEIRQGYNQFFLPYQILLGDWCNFS